MNTDTKKLYDERVKRVEDAIALRVPDRVPFFPQTNLLAIRYANITGTEAFYDYEAWFGACKKMNLDLEPDMCWPTFAALPGRCFDILGCTQIRWPGHGAPDNSSVQYVDKEYITGDELDQFIEDPTDFILSVYTPRVFTALAPLADFPPFKSIFFQGYKTAFLSSAFTASEISKVAQAFSEAAAESSRYFASMAAHEGEMRELGMVSAFSGLNLLCAFDALGDYFRGIRGIMLDMYRRPSKLIAAMDKIHPMLIKRARAISQTSKNRRVFLPLHLGADGFMSEDQFERFYWPYLKDMILTLIEEGFVPCPFFEGDFTARLKFLRQLPKGKIMAIFDRVDLIRVKEVLGDTMCIVGNMPVPLLQSGTPEAIRDYAKKLIDVVGKDGGFIMSSRSVLDSADPERVKLWADFTREYGVYA